MIGVVDFAFPAALAALAALPLLLLAAFHEMRRRREADRRYGGAPALRLGRNRILRLARNTIMLSAIVLLVLGFARPRWGSEPLPIEQRGVDVVIVLDVSRSMLAEDVLPSRAEAAAEGLADLLTHMTGNRVGLVTFAGSAIERSPLTLDLGAVTTLVRRAQPEAALVRPGTDIRLAIETALRLLTTQDAAGAQAIVLVADGEDIAGGDIDSAVQRANDRGIPIFTVFAATEQPTTLPEGSGGTDVTTGDRSTLQRISSETGGSLRELPATAGLAVEFRRLRQTTFDSEMQEARIERFPWFIAGALALLLLHELAPSATGSRGRARLLRRRRAVVPLGAGALLMLVGCSGTLAYQHVEAGNREYEAGRYEPALEQYRAATAEGRDATAIEYNIANALHQLGRYDEGVARSTAALETAEPGGLTTNLYYVLGSSAYMLGDLERSRDAFVRVLRSTPEDFDAKANLELVLRALTPPEPPPPPGDGPGEAPPEPPGNGEGDPPPQQPGQAPGDPPGEPDGDPGDQPDEPGDPGQPGQGGTPGGEWQLSPEEAQAALAEALAELGPELTTEQAWRILELARQTNDLTRLTPPGGLGGGSPPR